MSNDRPQLPFTMSDLLASCAAAEAVSRPPRAPEAPERPNVVTVDPGEKRRCDAA